jgi:hypothetical protein
MSSPYGLLLMRFKSLPSSGLSVINGAFIAGDAPSSVWSYFGELSNLTISSSSMSFAIRFTLSSKQEILCFSNILGFVFGR